MDLKSKNIQFHSNQLANIDRDLENLEGLKSLPMACLKMYNGSGKEIEISILKDLKEPLHNFLSTFFNNQKDITYKEIDKLLKQ